MQNEFRLLAAAGWLALGFSSAVVSGAPGAAAVDPRGNAFIGFTNFVGFYRASAGADAPVVLTSPVFHSPVAWQEAVVSWNVRFRSNEWLRVEVCAVRGGQRTRFYSLGEWCPAAGAEHRGSVAGQRDADGEVQTDTLVLRAAAEALQLRVTVSDAAALARVKLVGVSLHNRDTPSAPLPPVRAAWGRSIAVPPRSQMLYANSNQICSPTTVSMLLEHWSRVRQRPDLNQPVPRVADGVFDPRYPGWGNWSFNMAYAGAQRGLRAYATRFSDLAEVERWIAAGIPVGMSVCYNKLRGRTGEPNGHLVVCVGFTKTGDVIMNDGGTTRQVRKTFKRENVLAAWANSQNLVYLIYPEGTKLPRDRFGHWTVQAPKPAS